MQVDYIDHMGDDDRVVDAARGSFGKEASEYTEEQNKQLISYLGRHGHWTPFSHPMITMRETVPIFVARQRFKHMVGFTYNEVSRRYVDDTPTFFEPDGWRDRPNASIKQGSGASCVSNIKRTVELYGDKVKVLEDIKDAYSQSIEDAVSLYEDMIRSGVAPEQARMVLPQAMYTCYYVTGSLAAWARAYSLRIDSHSQKEIQELAVEWGAILEPLFPESWEALLMKE